MPNGPGRNRTLFYLAVVALAAVAILVVVRPWKKGISGHCADTAACRECRQKAAGFCEPRYISPQASGDIKVNGSKSCCGFEDPKLRSNCEAILACIRSEGCGQGNSPVGCLCGTAPYLTCAFATDWNGPCTAAYKAALAGGPPGTVMRLFGDPKSPIGVANNTYTCDVDSACPCGAIATKK